MLCSIVLMYSNSFGQGPGAFDFSNNVACDVYVTITAYNGSCGNIDCIGGSQGSIGPVLVTGNSTVDVASGYSGGGDVWAVVYVTESMDFTRSADDGVCHNITGTLPNCPGDPAVTWGNCNAASLP